MHPVLYSSRERTSPIGNGGLFQGSGIGALNKTKGANMGWSYGFDTNWKRDIGYGVPALCDHPGCNEEIDRGLGYVCGADVMGGEHGCGLFFCGHHLLIHEKRGAVCAACYDRRLRPFEPKPDVRQWIEWKLADESWQQWRDENPDEVEQLKKQLETAYVLTGDGE
jgi:hypothetical protein